MIPSYEQIIQTIQKLPAIEREKIRQWLEEQRTPRTQAGVLAETWHERVRKFNSAMRWIDEHRPEYLGQWVCLDGDNLISHGEDAKKVYAEARAAGIKIPFVEQIREEETSPFWGGWD